ncbi:hypothetical protein D9611_012649 [Ephemerocybe angulata]|uniref:Nephrocystin 3-like N-terminal domain-containing protein n=1 Tax=Ephemerocybe angulata TaxID=980116 RepID=A0A8H5B9A2_9AGAR|nr:hypothetical protein D9611_012649 [Tulosesus angulatus]
MPPRRKRSILKSLFCLGGGTLNEEPKTPTAPLRLTPSPPSDGRLNAEIPHLSENNTGTYLTMPHSRSTPSSHSQTPLDSPSNKIGQSAPMLGTSPQDSATQSPQTFFHQAHGFNFEHFEYNNTVKSDNDGWKQLIENTAPNALLTSDARHDPPRCDEDTRVEVTNEIMGWIQDRAAPQSLLCMTGAAGAGKSALQQTVAELCTNLGIFASCFFFSSSDGTRSNVSRIVPTLAYQLGVKNPALRRSIATAVEDDPLVFKQTLKIQMERLIVWPISRLPPQDLARFPYAVFIDGLDECAEEDRQRELLAALKACFLNGRTPLRIFLASRPELPIFEALRPGGYLRVSLAGTARSKF